MQKGIPVTAVLLVACGVLGLAIGSFLNVVIYRVPRGESVITPRSHCPGCLAAITPRDEVPVLSWLALGGRCRHCRTPISLRYPFVELLTAVLFVGVGLRFADHPALVAGVPLPGRRRAGPYGASTSMSGSSPTPSHCPPMSSGRCCSPEPSRWAPEARWQALLRGLGGLAAMYAFYFMIWYGTRGRGMGFGDVKLAGVLGLYLGFLGWQSWAVGLFAGFLIGGIVGIGLILGGGAGRKTKVPYGPFMVAGAFVAIIAGAHPSPTAIYISLTGS